MVILGQVRHLLTIAAGSFVTYGLMKSGDSGAFVEIGSGIAMGAIGMLWSWWQKSGRAFVIGLTMKFKHVPVVVSPPVTLTGDKVNAT